MTRPTSRPTLYKTLHRTPLYITSSLRNKSPTQSSIDLAKHNCGAMTECFGGGIEEIIVALISLYSPHKKGRLQENYKQPVTNIHRISLYTYYQFFILFSNPRAKIPSYHSTFICCIFLFCVLKCVHHMLYNKETQAFHSKLCPNSKHFLQ